MKKERKEKIQIQMASFFSSFSPFFFSLADVEEKSYRAEHSLMSFVNSPSPSVSLSLPLFLSNFFFSHFILVSRFC